MSALPGAAFGEAGGQVRCGGRLPGAVSACEGLQPSRGRAVCCLTRSVTGWKWPLTGHIVLLLPPVWSVISACPLWGSSPSCSTPWDIKPSACGLTIILWFVNCADTFPLLPEPVKHQSWRRYKCEVFKLVRVKLIQLLTYLQKGVQGSLV